MIARHVRGATRAYRWDCLSEVLPLEVRLGWDSVDEIRANARGWQTASFVDLPFRHHRPLGAREGGSGKEWEAQGEAAHFVGYRPLYLVARTLHHVRADRNAAWMIRGYLSAFIRRAPRLRDVEVRRELRGQQRLRGLAKIRREVAGEGAATPDR